MLVISRKVGERIAIGDDVQVIVTRIAGGRVTIGIDAPQQITVRRQELLLRPLVQPKHVVQVPDAEAVA